MRTAQICPTCSTYVNALCVIYNGENLPNINVSQLDNLEDILLNINDNLVPVHGVGDPTNSAIYLGQVYLNTATDQVFIAVSTGGGSADWEEVYTTANPPTPPVDGIDDVLAVGQLLTANRTMNVDTFSYTIKSDAYPGGLLQVNDTDGKVFIGDYNGDVNSTYVYIDDNNGDIEMNVSGTATINGDNIVRSVDGTTADASGNVALSKYKVYTAVISQSSTNPPTVDYTLENTLSGTPTLAYASVGRYQINLTFEFTNNKTVVFITPGFIGTNFTVGWERNSSSLITIHVRDSAGNYVDSLLNKATVEVRVYN